jgi:uncharacterized membrane protein
MPHAAKSAPMKLTMLFIMAACYIAAGIYHFVNPRMYVRIMPPYLPWHLPIVYFTGICEIALGMLLIPETTRPVAAWLLIAFLIAIFPANIQMTIKLWPKQNMALWISILRLPLQFVLIWWAWIYTRP